MARRRYNREYDREYDRGYGGGGYGGGYRRYSYSNRRRRRSAERQVEVVTFGLILLLFAVQILFGMGTSNSSTILVMILGGFVLLGSAFYQSSRRWRVNPMTWIGGAAMFLFGVMGLQTGVIPLGLGPLLPLLIFGVVIIASFLTGEF